MEPTGAAPLRPTDLREIGPYRLLGRLGEGGMGTVFLARAPTGRFVAVKVVKAEFANQEGFAARFHAEVENARRVASFCTAQVLDNGNTGDGRPYMVTEYIAGTPLSDQISAYGALDPGPLHGVALGVAAALAAIHVAGLVHRDLKPANVILSLSGPRVIDFGIARALDRETGFTMSGELLGSPGWWAPEQVKGQTVTPAADIFAWGCLVSYSGNGRHPFGRGDPITLATRVLHTQPDLGALPSPLHELVRRATAMEPGQRPTAQELLIALVGGSAPAPANPPTLVSTDLMAEWEPPRNVVDEPDITATFTTPPPSDTMVDRDPSGKGRAGPIPPRRREGPPSSDPSRPAPKAAAPAESPTPGRGPISGGADSAVPDGTGTPDRTDGTDAVADAATSVDNLPRPGQEAGQGRAGAEEVSVTELARREELAAREELARWQPANPQQPDLQRPANPQHPTHLQHPADLQQPTDLQRPADLQQPTDLQRPADLRQPIDLQRPADFQRPADLRQPADLQRSGDLRQPGDGQGRAPTIPPGDDPPTDPAYQRPRGTRWLIAAAAALAAITVTGAVLIVTSGRDTTASRTTATGAPAENRRPNDVGKRFPLGQAFDDPMAMVPEAPRCGLTEYEGRTQTQGQLCVLRWVMLNPGGREWRIGDPAVSLRDDRGGRHDAVVSEPDTAVIGPGDRIDGVLVFDLPPYRKPVELSATILKDGERIEVEL